ncbi:MAG: SCP2 sterol-binding domain-containing protein [Acidobacteria bacterium]|nr:SCP2 sterol-binding domain-containing protein [Acidobacteriota bacterium]
MDEFLSQRWCEEMNSRLGAIAHYALPEGASACVVVFEMLDAPSGHPGALSLSLSSEGARVTLGEHPRADTIVRLSYADAVALATGALDSANALRDGRIKVRGDVNALVPLAGWLRELLKD